MLNRNLLSKKERRPWTFKYLNKLFENSITKLSAEYILLHKAETTTPDVFLKDLQTSYFESIPFTSDCVNGEFIESGRFINYDTERAATILWEYLLDAWLVPDPNDIGDAQIESYRRLFYERYFSKIEGTTPNEKALALFSTYKHAEKGRLTQQRAVMRGVIAGMLEPGDNVLYYLCPISPNPKKSFRVTLSGCAPFFKRLVEQRGNDIILINGDIWSADFLLAFMEMLLFEMNTHKIEFMVRLATILYDRQCLL